MHPLVFDLSNACFLTVTSSSSIPLLLTDLKTCTVNSGYFPPAWWPTLWNSLAFHLVMNFMKCVYFWSCPFSLKPIPCKNLQNPRLKNIWIRKHQNSLILTSDSFAIKIITTDFIQHHISKSIVHGSKVMTVYFVFLGGNGLFSFIKSQPQLGLKYFRTPSYPNYPIRTFVKW